jgi:hypothetical protein
MRFPKATVESEFQWKGHSGLRGAPSICQLRIYKQEDQTIVIASDKSGVSVTNAAENLIKLVLDKFSLDPASVIWIEHYVYRDGFDITTFQCQDNVFSKPKWISIPHEIVFDWIDGECVPKHLFCTSYKSGCLSSLYILERDNIQLNIFARNNYNAFHIAFQETGFQSYGFIIKCLNPLSIQNRVQTYRLRLQGKQGVAIWDDESNDWSLREMEVENELVHLREGSS